MTIQEHLDLDRAYARVVDERKARGTAYWKERFAMTPAPARKVRVFAPESVEFPVTPRPSINTARYAKACTCGQPKKRCAAHYIIPADALDFDGLRAAMKAKRVGRPQRIAAAESDTTLPTYCSVETGDQRPSLPTLRKLCAWLGVAPEVFLRVAA